MVALAGCSEEVNSMANTTGSQAETTTSSTPTETETGQSPKQSTQMTSTPEGVVRENDEGEVFQSGVVMDAPEEITAGSHISITGSVSMHIDDARDNIIYGAVGTPDGTLYGLNRMSTTGSDTINVSATLPEDSAGQTLIWTFIPAVSETDARSQYQEEAANDRYQPDDLAIQLGTVTSAPTTQESDRIYRENDAGEIFQSGTVTEAPQEFRADSTVTVRGEIRIEIEDARDNIIYGAVGTPDGTLYGLSRMSTTGSDTVSVSATLPDGAADDTLIWTFVPATSESEARDQYQHEATNGRYQVGDLALPLGTVVAAKVDQESGRIYRENDAGEIFQSGTVTEAPQELRAGSTVTVNGKIDTEIDDAQDNIIYGAVGTPDGTLYGLTRMSTTGSDTVSVSATLPEDSAGQTLIWTFIPAISETEARSQYQGEAANDRYQPDDIAIPLGTVE